MRCPACSSDDTRVIDSRLGDAGATVRRRRECQACSHRFTTFERIQLRELTVLKKSGKKVPFDRDKLERSVQIALRKRPVDNDRVDRMISGIVRRVESLGETEVSSDVIGEIVMEGLQSIDSVAYVRFASVYKNFREAKDFEEFLGVISSTKE